MQEESSPWRLLLSGILEQALALLPLLEVFQLRCVCKRWNALIQCAEFQELSLRCPVPWGPFYVPWVRWNARGLLCVPWVSYYLAGRKWIHMPQFEFPLLNWTSRWSLVTANGGLVCFRSTDGRRALVCNPLTNRWKELPDWRLDSKFMALSCMIVDKQRNSYEILFAGNTGYKEVDPKYGMVDLYDSMMNTWSVGQNISLGNTLKSGAYCSGELYILTTHSLEGSCAVLILDLTMLRWREEIISIPEGLGDYPVVVACLGRIYLVGAMYDRGSFTFGNIVVFQLDGSNGWTKVSEYPDGHFLGKSGLIRGCGSNGSKIYVVRYSSNMRVAVYNFATSCWEESIYRGVDDVFNMEDIF